MKLKETILSLVYPRRATCLGCGNMIGLDRDELCDECRMFLARNRIGPVPVPKGINVQGTAFVCPYRGPGGSMVRTLKYASVKLLVEEMGTRMAAVTQMMHISKIDHVTFVPMHPQRQRERGFNHAELLARKIGEELGVPCEALLERTRNAGQQAKLSKKEREQNLKDTFRAVRDTTGGTILLIDDVMTTGATLKHCSKALREAGAAQIYFTAFAQSLGK